MSDQDELTSEEREALRRLAEGPEPPSALEEGTVARLRTRGLLAAPRPGWHRWLSAAALCLALFGAGVFIGTRAGAPQPATTSTPQYVLLLYDAPGEVPTASAMAARVAEYRDWARALRQRGGEVRGEKLADEARILGPSGPAASWTLGGYFVISATGEEKALEIARTCPHLKHGGRIEVRAIART